MIKKLAIVLGGVVGLILAAMVIVPLVVDVDSFRPAIVDASGKYLNGKLELGKLSLSLWGQVRVKVEGLKLSDASGRVVVAAEDVDVHVPLLPILSGSPEMTLRMRGPRLGAVKDRAGKLNVLTLAKASPVQVDSPPTPSAPSPAPAQPNATGSEGSFAIPAVVKNARLGVEVAGGLLEYRDESSQLSTQVRNLLLKVRGVSLATPMDWEVGADLDTQMAGLLNVKGPVRMGGKVQPQVESASAWKISAKTRIDLDALEIRSGGLFEKKAGVPANAEAEFLATPTELQISRADLRFLNAEIQVKGGVKMPAGGSPQIQLVVESNDIALRPWGELIPMAKEFELGGTLKLKAGARGPAEKVDYDALLTAAAVTAKAPRLKGQPTIDAKIQILPDRIESIQFSMKAPETDLHMQGKVVSFSRPVLTLAVRSSGMNLDSFVDLPPSSGKKGSEKTSTAAEAVAGAEPSATQTSAANPKPDYDALLDPLRKNPIAVATQATVTVNVASITAYGVRMDELQGKMSLRDLVASIDSFTMGLFGGKIRSSGSLQMKPVTPLYRFSGEVTKLDLRKAVESQLQLFKNTLYGQASFKIDGAGASLNPEKAIPSLSAKGSMKVEKAVFATFDVTKLAAGAISQALKKIGEKVPALKSRDVDSGNGRESRYESISSDFSIAGGTFKAPNFFAKSEAGQGIDVRGNTEVVLDGKAGYPLRAKWEVIDTHDLLKVRDLSVEVAGTQVSHLIAEGDGPVKFPMTVSGTAFSPQFTYTEVPEYLAGIAIGKVGRAAEGRVKAEAKKAVEQKVEELKSKAPPAVQDVVNKGLKGLFGN